MMRCLLSQPLHRRRCTDEDGCNTGRCLAFYSHLSCLFGCVSAVCAVSTVLSFDWWALVSVDAEGAQSEEEVARRKVQVSEGRALRPPRLQRTDLPPHLSQSPRWSLLLLLHPELLC